MGFESTKFIHKSFVSQKGLKRNKYQTYSNNNWKERIFNHINVQLSLSAANHLEEKSNHVIWKIATRTMKFVLR